MAFKLKTTQRTVVVDDQGEPVYSVYLDVDGDLVIKDEADGDTELYIDGKAADAVIAAAQRVLGERSK